MNIRTLVVACLFVLTTAVAVTVTPQQAHAQDKVTELAREKFKEGVKAYDTGQYEQARTLFLQAYALKRHPAVLLNLGQSELKANYPEDGGNHLQQFLREHKAATADQKKAAQAGIQDAQRKTAYVIVIVDTDGATVAVDGQNIGKTPLLDPYFVKPGKHEISAKSGGKSNKASVDAKRGTATPVTLNLGGGGAPPVIAPIPTPVPAPAPAPVPAPAYPPAPPPATGPVAPQPIGGPMGMPPEGPDTASDRQGFFPWFVDTPLAWVGAGLVGVGLIGSVAFGIAAGGASGSANDVSDAIRAEAAAQNNVPEGRQPCGPEGDPSKDLEYYSAACNQLRDNIEAHDRDLVGVAVFAAVGGAALIGTIVYYFIDSDGKGDSARNIEVTPMIGPDTQGLGITGRF